MRQEFKENEQKLLDEASGLVSDFTDLGLKIWANVFSQKGDLTYEIPSTLIFRQILELADSISELIKSGCIGGCKPLMRSALDCYLQFSFLLEDDQKRRASHFLYHYNKKKLSDLERVLFPENANSLNKKLSTDRLMKVVELTSEELIQAKVDHKTLNEILTSDENTVTAQEYGSKNARYWYGFFIKSPSIEELAKYLQETALYEVFFRPLSSFIHGEDIIHNNMIFGEGEKVGIKKLRDISQLNQIVSQSSILLKRTIALFVRKKMNNNLEHFSKLYLLWDRAKEFRK